MKNLGKKKVLISSYKRPYLFMGYYDGNGDTDFDENKMCIVRDVDEHQWECSRKDIQVYHVEQTWIKLRDSTF